jgi:hypothetical protein
VAVEMARMRVVWSGAATTGQGVSTFYFRTIPPAGAPAAVAAFFNAIKGFWTAQTSWTIPNAGDVISDDDGHLTGAWTSGSSSTVTGTASGSNWAQGVGTRVTWPTGAVLDGHRLVGATFLTSMNAIEFQTDGTLQAGTITAIQNAGITLVGAAPNLTVWHRPRPADPLHDPPLAFRPGGSANVSTCVVPDKVSWLRSRRT